jgi:ABC-type amino acid transport substrate-binding protein
MHELSTAPMRAQRQRVVLWIVVGALAGTVVSIGACAAHRSAKSATPAPPQLRVGITPNNPPLAFNRNGTLAGVEVDFANKLGPALGMQVSLIETPWEDLISALRDQRIDIIMSGMSITDEREQLVSFAHPYLRVGQMLLLRRADASRLRTNKAIDQPKIRIGFVTGTTGETYVREHFKRADAQGFESVDAGVAALRVHQIDVFVHNAPAIYSITAGEKGAKSELVHRGEPLTEEYLAWAVRMDDSALLGRVDTVLTQWNIDGTLDSVLSKWIKVRRTPPGKK